jgi:XTP/dITP diphosphohydrolase
MTTERIIVLGTHNRKKGLELAALLAPFGIALQTLVDFPNPLEVEETGQTFAENAQLKATRQASHLRQWVLGEDSGLSVDALDGRPGVYSARYSGPSASDDSNIDKLLDELSNIPRERRGAHYESHMALADPQGQVRAEAAGRCHGRIAAARRGSAGFGYDPVFEIVEYWMTFGELGDAVKGLLSHRGRAMRQLTKQLAQMLRNDPQALRNPD